MSLLSRLFVNKRPDRAKSIGAPTQTAKSYPAVELIVTPGEACAAAQASSGKRLLTHHYFRFPAVTSRVADAGTENSLIAEVRRAGLQPWTCQLRTTCTSIPGGVNERGKGGVTPTPAPSSSPAPGHWGRTELRTPQRPFGGVCFGSNPDVARFRGYWSNRR